MPGLVALAMIFDAVLLDRDGTLIEDVPYNGDPDKVRPVPGAREALDRLRAAGLRLGVVSNQSGLARRFFDETDLARVNARVEELLGPFDTWRVCPHDSGGGCGCRKPAPGLVCSAAHDLDTTPERCVVIGDIGGDVTAALAAGASPVLVPTPATRPEEVAEAPTVADTLTGAVELVLRRLNPPVGAGTGGHVLVARSDSAGDLLLTGPAIRAVAHGASRVTLLCGPRGRGVADLLPGVDRVIVHELPWIEPDPAPVNRFDVTRLRVDLAAADADEAVVFTSFHQSPLPLALMLRLAGVRRISAISDDYPGSLLDVRHRVPAGIPEAERALSLAAAAGYGSDDPALGVHSGHDPSDTGYVVVHPGASVPARACPARRCAEYVKALIHKGFRVKVTGGPHECDLTRRVSAPGAEDLGGRTTWAELADVYRGAACVVVGNTGPAHLAAAVGTPVVSLFAPTVDFAQWAPYRVPLVRLGAATAACRDSRATRCPVPGHPCLTDVTPDAVVGGVTTLMNTGRWR